MQQRLRKILHIDMDAFYASVEQRDRPELQGKPVIVGGDPSGRGVVSTCSYEARRFGVHSAMSSAKAVRLCPQAVFLKPRFEIYKAVSDQIRELFHEYTDLVEPLSLDEAFLDVTENKKGLVYATSIAREILQRIRKETMLTASAGVSFNKFLAKVASGMKKPAGITVVTPQQADDFIDRLPIGKFFGVGKVTEKRMQELGIQTGADLKTMDRAQLVHHFGKIGNYFYDIAHREDNRPVNPERIRKSIGRETTLGEDIDDREKMLRILEQIALQIEERMAGRNLSGLTITLKIRYHDFESITRSATLPEPVREAAAILRQVGLLLDHTEAGRKKVRLLGITISNLKDGQPKFRKYTQLLLPIRYDIQS